MGRLASWIRTAGGWELMPFLGCYKRSIAENWAAMALSSRFMQATRIEQKDSFGGRWPARLLPTWPLPPPPRGRHHRLLCCRSSPRIGPTSAALGAQPVQPEVNIRYLPCRLAKRSRS